MRAGLIAAALALLVGASCAIAFGASGFTPRNGVYAGAYTSPDPEPGGVRLRVERLRPGLYGVRLVKWSARLSCEDGSSSVVGPMLAAARDGKTFSGFVRYKDGDRSSFTGRFTSRRRLRGVVRVQTTGSTPAARCDTGAVKLKASRISGR